MAKNTLRLYKDPLITGFDMSGSVNGSPTNIEFFDNVGYQLKWTGGNPVGAITFQVSIDYDARFPTLATWTTIEVSPGTPLTISPGGSPGNGYADINQMSAMWIRPVYTTAGGSVGSLSCTFCAKGLQ